MPVAPTDVAAPSPPRPFASRRVVVTRPARETQRWVQALSARGFEALALPLIEITPAADPQALLAVWPRLGDYLAVMFVSGNAAEQFFASKPLEAPNPWAHAAIKTRAWATGPGTCQALLQAGVALARIDAPGSEAKQFDSEALWQLVRSRVPVGSRVLIVRGGDANGQSAGRDWLARQLAAVGVGVDSVAAYERRAPQLGASQLAAASQAASDGSVWLFSSSEAIANLRLLLPAQDWRAARAVATHPRIAQAAREAGFCVVCESRPSLNEVVASIESIE